MRRSRPAATRPEQTCSPLWISIIRRMKSHSGVVRGMDPITPASAQATTSSSVSLTEETTMRIPGASSRARLAAAAPSGIRASNNTISGCMDALSATASERSAHSPVTDTEGSRSRSSARHSPVKRTPHTSRMRIPRPARPETTAWSAATLASTAHPPVPQFYARGDVELARDRRFVPAVMPPILAAPNRQADIFRFVVSRPRQPRRLYGERDYSTLRSLSRKILRDWFYRDAPRRTSTPRQDQRLDFILAERGDDLPVGRLGEGLQGLGPHAAEHSEHQAEPRRHCVVWRFVNADKIVLAQSHENGLELASHVEQGLLGGFEPARRVLDLLGTLVGPIGKHDISRHGSSPPLIFSNFRMRSRRRCDRALPP